MHFLHSALDFSIAIYRNTKDDSERTKSKAADGTVNVYDVFFSRHCRQFEFRFDKEDLRYVNTFFS